jgi:hypothetical protein
VKYEIHTARNMDGVSKDGNKSCKALTEPSCDSFGDIQHTAVPTVSSIGVYFVRVGDSWPNVKDLFNETDTDWVEAITSSATTSLDLKIKKNGSG